MDFQKQVFDLDISSAIVRELVVKDTLCFRLQEDVILICEVRSFLVDGLAFAGLRIVGLNSCYQDVDESTCRRAWKKQPKPAAVQKCMQ
jgi:hypothetical protein